MNGNVTGQLHLALECNLTDATTLWDAAAARAADDFAMAPDDVVETIGPREDPELEACVLMLLDGLVRRGGVFDSIRITALCPATETAAAPVALSMSAHASAIASLRSIQDTRAA